MALETTLVTTTITVPGTCGELIQGWYTDWDEAVLVSCPITRYSQVSLRLRSTSDIAILNSGQLNHHPKSYQAARLILNELGRPDLGVEANISSQLLPGHGMASSTADIIGVIAGIATALNYPISPAKLAQLACQIEPSDSTMFTELTLFAYRGSGRYQQFGPTLGLPLLMLDAGQAIDTLTYNAYLNLALVRTLAARTQEAITMLNQGLANSDAAAVGAAATLSAMSYQVVNYNPLLEQALGWVQATGALGVVRAHSGSVVGLLYPAFTNLAEPTCWLATRFSGTLTETYLTSGGYLLVNEQISSWARPKF